MPPLQSNQRVLDVLHDKIVKIACGATEQEEEIEPTWVMSVVNVSTVDVIVVELDAGNIPMSSPHVSHTPD